MNQVLKIFILALPLAWLVSCSAPHDNPLDPASPNYTEPETPPTVIPDPIFFTTVRSVHKGRSTIDLYSIQTEIWSDSNMVTDSVTAQYKATTPRRMTFWSNGRWIRSFNANNVGDDDLESAIGEPFYFKVYTPDKSWDVGPDYFVRVIHDTPLTDSPDSNQTVGPYPTLSWPDFGATFPVRYQAYLEIENRYTAQIETLWTSDTLASTARSIQVSDSLQDSVPNSVPDSIYYRWALIVYDLFDNSSISVEAIFNVQAGEEK